MPREFDGAQLPRPRVDVANVTIQCAQTSELEVALDRDLSSVELVYAKRSVERLQSIEGVLIMNPQDILKDLGPRVWISQ